jgi:hypothetical protein
MLGFKPSSRVSVCSLVASAIACAWVAPAAGQATGDAAMAESLFREGKRLSAEHKYSEACPKFEESFKIDHGLGTLLNLASCHESGGQPASAWAEFSEATFETPTAATVRAVTVPALQEAPVAGAPPAVDPTAPAASIAPSTAPAATPAAGSSSGSHTALIVSGVATGAFLAATVVTGILYSGKRSDFKSANAGTDTTRFDKRDSAKTLGTVNLVCAGGALVSAGILVYFLATPRSHESPAAASGRLGVVPLIAPDGAGLLLRGAL